MVLVYGVDTEKEPTPEKVRDAIVSCFFEAHCLDAGISEGKSEATRGYCKKVVNKAFTESGGDFNKPTKDSIMKAMGWLGEFSKNFRDPSIIKKNTQQIMVLVQKLK